MHLVAVLMNPPLTPGTTTIKRVQMASRILQCESFEIVNLFPLATKSTLEIADLGKKRETWEASRVPILEACSTAAVVLLAYGVTAPKGIARGLFTEQVGWLHDVLQGMNAPVWTISAMPRHPSRWQRHTSRTYPSVDFQTALENSFYAWPPKK